MTASLSYYHDYELLNKELFIERIFITWGNIV